MGMSTISEQLEEREAEGQPEARDDARLPEPEMRHGRCPLLGMHKGAASLAAP